MEIDIKKVKKKKKEILKKKYTLYILYMIICICSKTDRD